MNRKEIQKISLQYRTLSSQMLKMNSQEEIYCIQQYFDFITRTEFIISYINECNKQEYDFEQIFTDKGWRDVLVLPSKQEDLISYGYQLLQYILDGPKNLISLCMGYTRSNKFADNIEAFVRKSIEPFVVAIRTYIELEFIECEDVIEDKKVTIFLSYCQKDADIADYLENSMAHCIHDKARISRDIRDVEYHESFKRFMQSIEKHDYVITIISDNYLKSRNCMFEMLEIVKESNFSKKLQFIVLENDDVKYYKNAPEENIGADVYSAIGQAEYSKYWSSIDKKLENKIEEIGNPMHAILQIKEKQIVQKILLDMPEFLEFIRDNKGISLSEHIEKEFADMISFMQLR